MTREITLNPNYLGREAPINVMRWMAGRGTWPHIHRFHELVIVREGEGVHETESESYPIGAGDVFLIKPGRVHGYENAAGLTLYNVLYFPEYLPGFLFEQDNLPGYRALFVFEPETRVAHGFESRLRLDFARLAAVDALLEEIIVEMKARSPGYLAMAIARFLTLIVSLSRAYAAMDAPRSLELLNLDKLLSHMRNHCEEPLTLRGLSDRMGMSKSALSRLFAKAVGQSPIDRLIAFRIERAMKLLKDPSLNVSEIAERCGFDDSNYFSRRFRVATGRSPRQFRKNG